MLLRGTSLEQPALELLGMPVLRIHCIHDCLPAVHPNRGNGEGPEGPFLSLALLSAISQELADQTAREQAPVRSKFAIGVFRVAVHVLGFGVGEHHQVQAGS
jgi:hypothetical protein